MPSRRSLVLIPAIITLAVTALRLGLELARSPAWLANSGLGGNGAVIGIAWLPFLFGPWFAMRLRPHLPSTKALIKPLAKTLLVYGLLARLPVFLLTIPALLAHWNTHYEKLPFEGGTAAKLAATFGAQMIFWACIWTVVTGLVSGLLVVSLLPQPKPIAA
jgi:hypothetical protein